MRLISYFVSVLILGSFCSSLSAKDMLSSNNSAATIEESLVMDKKWVPFPNYTDRESWDKLLGDNKSAVIKRGENKLKYQWKPLLATDFLEYERSGNRNIMQTPNSNNTNALSDLVVAELAEGKGRFMEQIINGVFFQCERTSWVLSAHLASYQKTKRAIPDHEDQVIDLGSGDLAGLLAWTHYFFNKEFDKVDPAISKRLHKELYDKIINVYRTDDRFWWMGFKLRPDGIINNWNPWCNFNVLQCMMLLENDPEQLSKDVYRTMQSTDKFINYVNQDGACEEGPSYWGHAAGKLYDYLKILKLGTGGKLDFFKEPLIKNMGEYMPRTYVGNDWVVNFADASALFSSDASLIYRYGEAVNSSEMMGFGAHLVQDGKNSLSTGLDIFRRLESIEYDGKIKATKSVVNTPEFIEYPETQFYYLRNKSGFFLATKGGHNAESHNHNDIGTVSLYYDNQPILIDVGVGTYTRQTFGPERYSIWTMRSLYHNLPMINGQEQQFGREYVASDIKLNKSKKEFSVNLAKAYSSEAKINNWNRTYQLLNNGLEIRDDFSLSGATKENEINFMLWGIIDTSEKGKVLIDVKGKKLVLEYDAKLFEPSLETIDLPDTRLSKVWGEKVYRLTLKANQLADKAQYKYKVVLAK